MVLSKVCAAALIFWPSYSSMIWASGEPRSERTSVVVSRSRGLSRGRNVASGWGRTPVLSGLDALQAKESIQRLRDASELRHLAFRWKSSQYRPHVFRGYRCRSGGFVSHPNSVTQIPAELSARLFTRSEMRRSALASTALALRSGLLVTPPYT